MSRTLVVRTNDCVVSADACAALVTYALGSCIAVCVSDPAAKVAGLLHFMLPHSSLESVRGHDNPFLYADTGIPELLRRMTGAGATGGRLVVRLTGGAQLLNDNGVFSVGKQNQIEARRALMVAGLPIDEECIGGTLSRWVRLHVGTGEFLVGDAYPVGAAVGGQEW